MDRATPEGRKELAGLVDGVLIKPVVTGASAGCGVDPPQSAGSSVDFALACACSATCIT
jgi:hypothetical protein